MNNTNYSNYDEIERMITSCDTEPIHEIGSIQNCGYLIAVSIENPDFIRIISVSENFKDVPWMNEKEPRSLLSKNLYDVFDKVISNNLANLIVRFKNISHNNSQSSTARKFTLLHLLCKGSNVQFQGTTICCSIVGCSNKDILIFELEELKASDTVDVSIPHNKMLISGDIIGLLQTADSQQAVTSIFLDSLMNIIPGYDRGMVYRFAADESGEVIYENIRESSKDYVQSSYLNLRFPAGDIPLIARKLFILNNVRFVVDVNGSDSKLISTINSPLDLTMSCLRSSAPVHLLYLRNMGVLSSLAIAIVVNGRLWGLYVFHAYKIPVKPSVEERIMFEMLGTISSMRIDSFEREIHSKRKITLSNMMLTSPSYKNLTEFLRVNCMGICKVLEAQAIILHDVLLGQMVFGDETITLTEEGYDRIYNISQDKSVVSISNYKQYLNGDGAGLIFYKQTTTSIAIIRKSIVSDVVWGGSPDKVVDENNRLQPRNSFSAFIEKAKVECKPWTEIDKQLAEQFFERCIDQIHLETLETFRISLDQSNSDSAKAIEAAEELYEFFAHMSHELRTPFHGVISALQLLDAASCIDEKERKDIVKSALECGENMLKTLNDILTIAKSRHNVEADRKPMSISNLISACKRMMDPLAEAKHIRFGITLSTIYNNLCDSWENVTILSDETKILQTINNLTNNAIKFTPINGFVKVNVSLFNRKNAKDRWNELKSTYNGSCVINDHMDPFNSFDIDNEPMLMFEVSDSGCGIIESNMSAMFNAYKQLSQGVEKVYQGTGLGLHICRSHIKILNGFICIASTINVGSVISFIIPANLIKDEIALQVEKLNLLDNTFDQQLSKNFHFLVVDDSLVNLRLTRRKLQLAMGEDLLISTANDGLEAISFVKNLLIEHKYDSLTAILMDYHMPNCSGLQAIKQIRLLENEFKSSPVYVVAFTADVNEKSCTELIEAGANEVLSKPSPSGKLENICINVANSKMCFHLK